MNATVSAQVKENLTDTLLKEPLFLDLFNDRENLLDLFGEIFPLKDMPSTDSRHPNALEDFSRHLVLNDDWAPEYVFRTRLDLPNLDQDTFLRFFDAIVSPDYQKDINTIHALITSFAPIFSETGLKYVLTGYKNNLPVYKLNPATNVLKDIPRDIKQNDIPFFLLPSSGRPDRLTHKKPETTPSFVLTKDGWDDYTAHTLHHLFYYPGQGGVLEIGAVKIMKRGEKDTLLPDNFLLLDDSYCSLGTDAEFYQNLNKYLGNAFTSVLFALRDAAFFPMIYEAFEEEKVFKESLIRGDQAERNSRTIAYAFAGGNPEERYKFTFKFRPLFAEEDTDIPFPLSSSGEFPRRVIALIGKNGTGKTQMLSSLAKNLSDRTSLLFRPQTPVFGKILAVSYSVFDTFEIPESDNSFNYKYCGLKGANGKLLTDEEFELRFHESAKKIRSKGRIAKLVKVLRNFIDQEIVDLLIKEDSSNKREFLDIDLASFASTKQKLSSGQTILLYIVVELLAELRLDSLILFDEPETHLHPNAITQLVSAIYDLLDQFDSYCIIATHSPLIIQSVTSDSVYVTEKEGDTFSIRKISTESFGENLSNITDEIFGNRDVSNEYKRIVDSFIKEGKNYEEIVGLLESDEVPLSLNAKLYIRSAVKPSHA